MEAQNLIPIFQKKEVKLDYLSDSYEDFSRVKIKFLWTAMRDADVNLRLSQLAYAMEYREKAVRYASELISILTGEDFIEYLENDFFKFKENFKPKSKSEDLIFHIFRCVLDEIFWLNGIIDMAYE